MAYLGPVSTSLQAYRGISTCEPMLHVKRRPTWADVCRDRELRTALLEVQRMASQHLPHPVAGLPTRPLHAFEATKTVLHQEQQGRLMFTIRKEQILISDKSVNKDRLIV